MRNEILHILLTLDAADKKVIIGLTASWFVVSVETFDLWVKILGGVGGILFIVLGIIYRVLQIKEVQRNRKNNNQHDSN